VQGRRGVKIALVFAVCVFVLTAWQLGWFALVAEPALLRARILEIGPWGYLVFLLGFCFLAPFGLPGILFVLASAYIWPRPVAYGLSLAGAVGSSAVGFAFARFVARDFVDKRLPARVRKYDPWIEKRGWIAAAVLRAILLMHPLLHAAFGLSRIRFLPYIAGSTLGYIPSLAVVVWVSGSAIDVLSSLETRTVLLVLGAIVLLFLAYRGVRARRAARRARDLHRARLAGTVGRPMSTTDDSDGLGPLGPP
jgi:uncharacterized membrane protein YdjX (TVP38/TMEM64 family)